MADETHADVDGMTPETEDGAGDDSRATAVDTTAVDAGDDEREASREREITPYEKRLRTEAANRRKENERLKAENAELAEAKAELDKLRQAQMSEEERRAAELEEKSSRLAQLEADLEAERKLRLATATDAALIAALSKPDTGIVDAQAALKLLDRSDLEFDDDGKPTPESVQAAIDGLVDAYPFMKAGKARASVGDAANPTRDLTPQPKSDADMRASIYGSSQDVFDPARAAQHGGGVIFTKPIGARS